MTGRHFRMGVGVLVILADLVVYVYEHLIVHTQQAGWQVARDHLPYLVLGYLLIDWRHASQVAKDVLNRWRKPADG